MHAAGFLWLALNVGDGIAWQDWRIVVDRARGLGVDVFPWARCYTLDDCSRLLDLADDVAFRAILNIEDEFQTAVDPNDLAALLDDSEVRLDEIGLSSVAWLYNDVDFSPLSAYPMLLQLFPTDMRRDPADLEQIQADCVVHARDKGFTYVGVTFQTYAGARPEWYAYYEGARSLYTGDDVGAGNWGAWSP